MICKETLENGWIEYQYLQKSYSLCILTNSIRYVYLILSTKCLGSFTHSNSISKLFAVTPFEAIFLNLQFYQQYNVLDSGQMTKLRHVVEITSQGFPDRVIPGAMRGCVE